MSTSETPARRRRWPIVVIIVVVVVGALVGAFFIADAIARSTAEKVVADEFAAQLESPETGGSASADDIDVRIGGASVILQYLRGTFDTVDITASQVAIDGVPLELALTGHDVPIDTTKPVGAATGQISVDQAGLDALLAANNVDADISLGDGTVTYEVSRTIFGFPLTFTLTATPSTTADSLVFTPTEGVVSAGSASFDVSGIIDSVLANNTLSFCIADQVPAGVELAGVDVTPTTLTADFEAKDLVIADLTTTGSCAS
ncbi:MAG: DUF2993 domain-containing protein [Leifsonia sp.]